MRPGLNIFRRLHSFSTPVVDLTESHSDTESEQESDVILRDEPQIPTPVHATTVRPGPLRFLQRPETELSSFRFPSPLCGGQAQTSARDSDQTTVPPNSPPPEFSQVESAQVIESEVTGRLKGNWANAGELLNTQLSQGRKISPHQTSLKDKSRLQTKSPSLPVARSTSSLRRNCFSSLKHQKREQANSVSSRITSQAKGTPNCGHTPPDAHSEWQPDKVQAGHSSKLPHTLHCDVAEKPRLSAADIEETHSRRSSTHESEVVFQEPSYLFRRDACYDEPNDEESRFDSDPRSASPDDATFVCPAALSKLLSGQGQALVRAGSGLIPLFIFFFCFAESAYISYFLVFLPPCCFYRFMGWMKTRELQLCFPNRAWGWFTSL